MGGTQWRAGARALRAAGVTFFFVPQEECSQDLGSLALSAYCLVAVPTLTPAPKSSGFLSQLGEAMYTL